MKTDMESAPSLEDRAADDLGVESRVVKYLPDLDDLDMNEAAKIELLTTLHDILSHFVDMGFDLKSVDVCGQLFGHFTDAASGVLDGVESGASIAPETTTSQPEEDSA